MAADPPHRAGILADDGALFSNTARAHELRKTHDWVVIYFHTDRLGEGQRTVVTETHGALTGWRVVRGREDECRVHYRAIEAPSPQSGAPAAASFCRARGPSNHAVSPADLHERGHRLLEMPAARAQR